MMFVVLTFPESFIFIFNSIHEHEHEHGICKVHLFPRILQPLALFYALDAVGKRSREELSCLGNTRMHHCTDHQKPCSTNSRKSGFSCFIRIVFNRTEARILRSDERKIKFEILERHRGLEDFKFSLFLIHLGLLRCNPLFKSCFRVGVWYVSCMYWS